MLIHEYTAYKIWESNQRENELILSRTAYGLNRRKAPLPNGWWTLIAAKLASLIR